MTQEITTLERDIAETRARLDLTIDRLQDKLSVSGIVDDLLGTARAKQRFSASFDDALAVIRRNPVPVMLIAAGVGLLLSSIARGQQPSPRARARSRTYGRSAAPVGSEVPVLNTGAARVYDPDTSPRHPLHDTLESRRELSARA